MSLLDRLNRNATPDTLPTGQESVRVLTAYARDALDQIATADEPLAVRQGAALDIAQRCDALFPALLLMDDQPITDELNARAERFFLDVEYALGFFETQAADEP